MAKGKFERTKPHVNVGTIGHVDHGKTTLTAALTKVWRRAFGGEFKAYDQIDAAPEEKARGITISTAHVEYETAEPPLRARRLPGPRRLREEHDHRRRADGRRDPGVSAADGPMPQTREHILLARQVGVPYIVVFLNKADMVGRRRAARAGRDGSARAADASTTSRATTPRSSRGSALNGAGRRPGEIGVPSILKLVEALDTLHPGAAARDDRQARS